ncbi:hypothetical protein Tco_1531232 [Tanacetum coccineum]
MEHHYIKIRDEYKGIDDSRLFPPVKLTHYTDEQIASLGRTNFRNYVFHSIETLEMIQDKPFHEFHDKGRSVCGHYEMIRPSGDVMREAALFYGKTVNVRVPVPSEDAVQLLKYWLDLEIRAKVTFIVMQLSEALNCGMGLIVDVIKAKEVEKKVECLVHVLRFMDGNDENYSRGMWRRLIKFEEPEKHKGILQIAQLVGSVSEDNNRKCVIVAQRLLEMLN